MTASLDLFLISTPLQLLNATEAKSKFNIADSNSILIILAYSNNLIPLKKSIDPSQWREVHFVNDDPEYLIKHEKNVQSRRILPALKVVILNLLRIKKMVRQFNRVHHLVAGNYSNLEQLHIINSIKFDQLILLDDGIATIDINNRRKNNISALRTFANRVNYKTLFKWSFLRYRIKHPKSACFFTAYDVEVGPNDRIVKNNFSESRKLIRGLKRTEEIYLLGGPYSEVYPELLTEEDYFYYLLKTKDYFPGMRMIYIPHKVESAEKLKRIEQDLRIEIKRIHVPIELFLLRQAEIPRVVSGFITSALVNCKEIFGDDLDIVAVKISDDKIFNRSLLADIGGVYDYFLKIADGKFKIVSFD